MAMTKKLPWPVPDDVILPILLNLPIKSLLRFKCVCRVWFSWIINQDFIEQHLSIQRKKDPQIVLASRCCDIVESMIISRRSSSIISNGSDEAVFDHCLMSMSMMSRTLPRDCFNMLHSCDGILCFVGFKNIFVCNPSTKEFQFVLYGGNFDFSRHRMNGILKAEYMYNNTVGFGRDEVTKELKIVRLFGQGGVNYERKCEVLTLGPDAEISWRSLGKTPIIVRGATSARSPVCVKGAIHWVTVNRKRHPLETMIVSFDLHRERFLAIAGPICLSSFNPVVGLTPLRNSLCLVDKDIFDLKLMNIWIFMEDGNWEKLYVINLEIPEKWVNGIPFVELKDGLLGIDYNGERLQMYNPKSKRFMNVRKLCQPIIPPTAYHESLVPLYGEKYMGLTFDIRVSSLVTS